MIVFSSNNTYLWKSTSIYNFYSWRVDIKRTVESINQDFIVYEERDEEGIRLERGPLQPSSKVAHRGPPPHPPHHQPSPHGWHNRGPSPMEPRPFMRQSPCQEPPPPEFRYYMPMYFSLVLNILVHKRTKLCPFI